MSPAKSRYSRPIHSLVLDTAPLLTTPYGQIKSFNATNYYTVPLAKEEVKDETARAALQIWGNELNVRQPHSKSIEEVTAFAKKTGDYGVLSVADLHVLALTYELECELNHGDWRLLKEPGSKERRGPQPAPRPQSYSTVASIVPENDNDDDDTRSVVTDITTATITPSESASGIYHRNSFNVLQPPSSSGSSTPQSTATMSHKLATFDDDSVLEGSQMSTTSTAKATIDLPTSYPKPTTQSILSSATQSLVSARSSASKDWSTQSDEEEDESQTPTESIESPPLTFEQPHLSFEQSLRTLSFSDDDDDEGIWITPNNIRKRRIRDKTTTNSVISSSSPEYSRPQPRQRSYSSEKPIGGAMMKSACMTGDFAMQNVALQMGLNLVSMDGGGVRHVKTWVLRCHGCFNITKNMELKFCPSCGGQTLMRTSTSTNSNGEVTIHLKKNMQWTNRGTKFSLPRPAGMTATPSLSAPPPILRADQKEYVHANEAKKKREKDLMDPDNLPAFLDGSGKTNGFGFGGRSSGRIGGGRGRGTNAVRRR